MLGLGNPPHVCASQFSSGGIPHHTCSGSALETIPRCLSQNRLRQVVDYVRAIRVGRAEAAVHVLIFGVNGWGVRAEGQVAGSEVRGGLRRPVVVYYHAATPTRHPQPHFEGFQNSPQPRSMFLDSSKSSPVGMMSGEGIIISFGVLVTPEPPEPRKASECWEAFSA